MIAVARSIGASTQHPQGIEIAVKLSPKPLTFLGTDFTATWRALTETFGQMPIQLNTFEHMGVLKGMANAAGEGAAPYKQILEALEKYEEIEVRIPA